MTGVGRDVPIDDQARTAGIAAKRKSAQIIVCGFSGSELARTVLTHITAAISFIARRTTSLKSQLRSEEPSLASAIFALIYATANT